MAVIFFENERVVWGTVYRGEGNVVLGRGALEAGGAVESEVLVTDNTAVGLNAGATLKEGVGNTAVGNAALSQVTKVGGNTAVGSSALEENKTGSNNTAIGITAMARSAGGEETFNNIAVGASSLIETVGKNNVGVGVGTLFENKSGNGNVAIGTEAGEKELGSNKLYIANSSTETPLIKGDFSAETLAINGTLTTNHVAPIEIAAGQTYEVREKIQGLWKENISIQGTLNLQGRFDEVGVTESSPWFLPAPVAPTSNVVIPANTQTWFYLNAAVEGTINLQGQLVGIG